MLKVYRDGTKFTLKTEKNMIKDLNLFSLQATMRSIGVSQQEITEGLNEMFKKDDNIIDYGIHLCWTYTDKVRN